MRPDGGAPVRGVQKPKSPSPSKSLGSFTQKAMQKARQMAPQVRQQYTQSRQAPAQRGGGGGFGGGGGIQAPAYTGGGVSTLSTGIVAEPAPPPEPPKPSLEDWRAKDATFNAANQTIDTDLNSLLRQLADENAKYDQDFNLGLRNLGWDATANRWNPDDLLGAYGQSRNNMFNDFSGRGMLDSSFFQTAQGDLDRNFERQRNDMNTDRQRVMSEYGASQGRARQDAQNARQQALADAAARYAAMYGV
ncbi:hypothetical protein [Cellulosimicrobium phage DS1]|nr:hypothetical protein [Cellulosimicrobium phage DS1]